VSLMGTWAEMCGIAGTFQYAGRAAVNVEELRGYAASMQRRGPDGEGVWMNPEATVGLAHRRLSIIDLSDAATQPMHSACGRFSIAFNGEIYNYRELAKELTDQGVVLRTQSDTEVLLALFAQTEERMLNQLRGMFAFAIWDQHEKRLFLARDTFGIKPLYVSLGDGCVRFASQVRTLVDASPISREIDPAAQAGFLLWGSIPEPFTLYRSISTLPAGHYQWVDQNGAGQSTAYERWQDLCDRDPLKSLSADAIRNALMDSVKAHQVSDVPVGAFLSSGIDSCLMVALMRQISNAPITTLTVGFDEFVGTENDELPLARAVAQQLGTDHHEIRFSKEDFLSSRDRILSDMDQPSIDGINTWMVSRAASDVGMKVAISGLGGDELFGGYPSFDQVPAWSRWTRWPAKVPGLGKLIRLMSEPICHVLGIHPKAAGLVEYGGSLSELYLCKRAVHMPWELSKILGKDQAAEGLKRLNLTTQLDGSVLQSASDKQQISALESTLYMKNQLLRDTDWASMAHSLEVRVPLVDRELVRAVTRQPMTSKQAVARSFGSLLPETIINKPKTGFSTPIQQWLFAGREQRSEFCSRDWCRSLHQQAMVETAV